MYRHRKLSFFIAVAMLLQLALPGLGPAQEVKAATNGPVLQYTTPQNNMTDVPLGLNLKMLFDENVKKGSSTAYLNIYKTSGNELVESISATSSRVTINPSNPREVIIDPTNNLEPATEYHVLIDSGAFQNVSNSASYAGIQNATMWKFTTVPTSAVDTIRPSYLSISPQGNGIPITSLLTIKFDETVYAAEGYIVLRSQDDTRNIPVTSSSVTGSGTDTIVIRPEGALLPNTTYAVEVSNVNFQDASGNTFAGISGSTWSFTTASAPVNLAAVSPLLPADNAVGVSISAPLQITFDQPVQANTSANPVKYVEIRRVNDNALFQRIPVSSTTINGNTVTINHNTFASGTAYYVLIDPGAYTLQGDASQWFYGITSATVWDFVTGNDTTPPTVTTYVPARNGQAGGTSTLLKLTFSEPVYPNSGTIEIRTVSGNTLFRSIPITSERVTGGGTNTITIDANRAVSSLGEASKAFVNNTRYYVTIGNRALQDAAGNYFSGISGTSGWTFTVTQDTTLPQLVALSPANNATAVPLSSQEYNFAVTFSKAVTVDTDPVSQATVGKRILFYPPSGSAIEGRYHVDPKESKRILIRPVSDLALNTKYYINIEPEAVTDLVGNAFVGILNQYQWTFTTIGGDRTPPAVSKTEASGSTIRIIYNEPLKESAVPSPAHYYVTVAGTARNVTAVKVEGNMVTLTLQSAASSNQKIEVSYTQPTSTTRAIQDLSGNLAPNMVNVTAANGFTGTAPTIIGGSAYGSTVSLTFSEALNTVNPYAYTQFTVNVGGVNRTPTAIYHSGSVIQLTLPVAITSGQSVRVSYTPGSYPLTGVSGNRVNSINSHSLTGNSGGGGGVDTVAPVILTAYANGSQITLTYNETLNFSSNPSIYQYYVTADNVQKSVSSAVISGNQVILTLTSSVTAGQAIRVTFYGNSSSVTDLAGNAAASFSNMAVIYGTGSGGGTGQGDLKGAILKGSRLTLNFGETLNPNSVPLTSMFIVRINNQMRYVTEVQISGNSAVLVLSLPANPGESATVTYMGGQNGLKTMAGTAVGSFSDVSAANQTTLLDTLPAADFEEAVGGGVAIKSTGAMPTTDSSPAGVSANRYSVLNDRVITAVVTAREAGISSPRVLFKVPDHERAALVSVPLSTLELAQKQGKNVTFGVQYGDHTFEIPLSSLNFSALSKMAGGSMSMNQLLLAIDTGSSSKTSALTTAINNSSAQVISGPIHYEVMVMNGMTKQAVSDYKGYLTRSVKLNGTVSTSQTSAVWFDPVTGTLSYVPTTFATVNGVTRATFKRKGNSAYAIVRNTFSFSDLGSHWATSAVNSMARKFIVDGKTSTAFAPNQPITRGEFAAYIAKGLGLAGDREAAAKFKDVNVNTVMGAYIGAAAGNDIIAGTTPTTFSPNSYITRQDMAIIMLRAAKEAGMTISMPNSADSYLAPYKDKNKISAYAKNAMAQAVYAGFINGQSPTSLNPTGNATRAEATVMIMRLLQKADLLTS